MNLPVITVIERDWNLHYYFEQSKIGKRTMLKVLLKGAPLSGLATYVKYLNYLAAA